MAQLLVLLAFLVIAVALFVLVLYIPQWKAYQRFSQLSKKHKVPPFLPLTLPYIGNSFEFHKDPEAFIVNNHQKHGKSFAFYLQDRLYVSLDMELYAKEFYSISDETFSMDVVPNILPLSEVYAFPKLLRVLHPTNLKADTPAICTQLQKHLDFELLSNKSEGGEVKLDLEEFFMRACAVFNLYTFTGMDFSEMSKYMQPLAKLYEDSNLETDRLYSFPLLAPIWKGRLKKYEPVFEALLVPLIAERKKMKQSGVEKRDFLQVLINHVDSYTGEPLPDRQILYELFSILQAAGSVATSMSDVLKRVLANDPTYLNKIMEEQERIIKEDGEVLNANTLSKMSYFDAVIKETLRLEFTLTSWRLTTEDVVFHDGLVVPKGVYALMTAIGINYNDKMFPEHMKWNPDRFADLKAYDEDAENKEILRAKDAFLWGAGRHPCAGRQHAVLGMKLLPVMLFRQLAMRTANDQTVLYAKRK